jgi:hypothetical protein
MYFLFQILKILIIHNIGAYLNKKLFAFRKILSSISRTYSFRYVVNDMSSPNTWLTIFLFACILLLFNDLKYKLNVHTGMQTVKSPCTN